MGDLADRRFGLILGIESAPVLLQASDGTKMVSDHRISDLNFQVVRHQHAWVV